MVNWKLLFSVPFWFSFGWNPLQPKTALILTVFFALVFVGGIGCYLAPRYSEKIDKPLRRVLQSVAQLCLTAGILGLLWTFFAYEQVPLLSARFWMLALAIGVLVRAGFIGWTAHIIIPAEREAARVKERFEKYLPK